MRFILLPSGQMINMLMVVQIKLTNSDNQIKFTFNEGFYIIEGFRDDTQASHYFLKLSKHIGTHELMVTD